MLTKKLQDIVDEALSAGLEVTIKKDRNWDSFNITVESGYADEYYKPSNLLQQIVQWEKIIIHAYRSAEKGPYKILATKIGLGDSRELDPKLLKYIIQHMGEDVEKNLKGQIKFSTAA